MSRIGSDGPERLNISVVKGRGGILVVSIAGYLDAGTYDLLENRLEKALDAGQSRIVVNMTKLTYISSAGVGVLLAGVSRAKELGGDFVFLNPTPSVRDVFDLIGMSKFCKFAASMEKAEEMLLHNHS